MTVPNLPGVPGWGAPSSCWEASVLMWAVTARTGGRVLIYCESNDQVEQQEGNFGQLCCFLCDI